MVRTANQEKTLNGPGLSVGRRFWYKVMYSKPEPMIIKVMSSRLGSGTVIGVELVRKREKAYRRERLERRVLSTVLKGVLGGECLRESM